MCQNVVSGIVSGVVTAIILWVVSVLWNYKSNLSIFASHVLVQTRNSEISTNEKIFSVLYYGIIYLLSAFLGAKYPLMQLGLHIHICT